MRKVNRKTLIKLLVINQYYPPDIASTGRYVAEICESLAHKGIEVCVITGQPSYTSLLPEASPFELMNGVRVYRISLGGARGREQMWRRIKGYLRFLWGAWRKAQALIESEGIDMVLTFHNPPFVGLIGAYLTNKYSLPFIFSWFDLYPEALLVAGRRLPRFVIQIWERLNRWILDRCTTVIVLGEGPKKTLMENKKISENKIKVIPIWAYPELSVLPPAQSIRKELGIKENHLLLLYAGNMGIMHPLDPILDAAAELRSFPVQFLFVGDGVKRKHLISRIEKENLYNVSLLPYQPEDRFVQLIASSDACFVTFQPGMERVTVPSRGFTFLSAGRPLITIMTPNADLARIVTDGDCGWNVTSGQELVDLIRYLLKNKHEVIYRGQRAKEVYYKRFCRQMIIEEYANALIEASEKS